jgi:DNA polymerase-3 subunit delta
LTPEQFQKEIGTAARKPFYLVKGPEPLAIQACLKAASEALSEDQRSFNLHFFRLGEDTVDDVLRAASTSSFFSRSPKIVILKAPDTLPRGTAPAVSDGLAGWIRSPQPDASIVMFQEKPDGRLRFVEAARKAGGTVDCPPPSHKEMAGWIQKVFKSKGATLNPEAARLILNRAGDSLSVIMNAAEKLSLWPGTSRPVTEADVRDQVPLAPSAIIYELGEPVGERRPQGAVPVLLDLLEGASPFAVIAVLTTHIRRLLSVKVMAAAAPSEGKSFDSAMAELGLKGYYRDKMVSQAMTWTLAELKAAVRKAEDAYRMMYTTSVPAEIILEELCLGLSLPAPPRAGGPAGGRSGS